MKLIRVYKIPGQPVALARPRFSHNHGRVWDSQHRIKDEIIFQLRRMNGTNEPLSGPLQLILEFHMPIGKSTKHKPDEYHINVPDLDNMAKLYSDVATTAGLWYDDSQVAELMATKIYGIIPQTIMTVRKLETYAHEKQVFEQGCET